MTSTNRKRAEKATAKHDVIVVGAGIAGLTAGSLLAHAGKSVLVIAGSSGAHRGHK